jgi:2-keto-4-pentenoate hydratase
MTDLNAFADALIAAHRSGTRAAPFAPAPATLAEAYQVQSRIIAGLADLGPVAGFKTARKSAAPPTMAPIRAAYCLPSGAEVTLGDEMGIELEVGWKIIAPLPDPAEAGFDAALLRCIQPVPVIELVDTRLSGPRAEDPLAKLADFQINHGLIIGTPLANWEGRDFATVTARMQAGDTQLVDGPAEVPGGSALATLVALLGQIGTHCGGLQVGQIVITGSLHPLTYVRDTCEVRGQIDGLGSVSLTLR